MTLSSLEFVALGAQVTKGGGDEDQAESAASSEEEEGGRIEGHLWRAESLEDWWPRRIGAMAPSLRREGEQPPVYGELIGTLTSGICICLALLGVVGRC